MKRGGTRRLPFYNKNDIKKKIFIIAALIIATATFWCCDKENDTNDNIPIGDLANTWWQEDIDSNYVYLEFSDSIHGRMGLVYNNREGFLDFDEGNYTFDGINGVLTCDVEEGGTTHHIVRETFTAQDGKIVLTLSDDTTYLYNLEFYEMAERAYGRHTFTLTKREEN